MPDVICSFPCKKASHMSVRPFSRGEFFVERIQDMVPSSAVLYPFLHKSAKSPIKPFLMNHHFEHYTFMY